MREVKRVIACNVEHGGFDLCQAEFARRVQEREFLNFLVRRQQVAFDAIGKKLQRVLAFFTFAHVLPLRGQALGNPLRQVTAFDAVDFDHHARLAQRIEPSCFGAGEVNARKDHQGHGAVILCGGFGQGLNGARAFFAGLAAGNAHFNELPISKQTECVAAG